MELKNQVRRRSAPTLLAFALVFLGGCAYTAPASRSSSAIPDPRVGLRSGRMDAGEAIWNLRLLSKTPVPANFSHTMNSDLSFTGPYAIQGNYNGYQIWDISNPRAPRLTKEYVCPASQSDVSVYKNLLFVSGESLSARLDCGTQGVMDTVSKERLRGLRIFDIRDVTNPKYVGNVQTCRGSHTHTVVEDPSDPNNIYVYISGSKDVRSPSELPGCVSLTPDKDPNSALFRIEVVKVPLAHPEMAAVVSSPRIFQDLNVPLTHTEANEDVVALRNATAAARASGGFVELIAGRARVMPPARTRALLDSVVLARGGSGRATAADSAALRAGLQAILDNEFPRTGRTIGSEPTQCHDITVYPAIGLAGGACRGYGLLLDIRDVAHPVRIAAVADSNFSYWHSATFNNDGTKVLFTDEWGGGGQPKCRASDKREWGANAIFTIADRKMVFQDYYKLPAPQTQLENCVAHNGSLIPIPGRDVMVQSWYQGGISVFDWTDPKNAREIAYFDRGPLDSVPSNAIAGSWSAYWYNGKIVSSEIARGLDILELVPSAFISQNEIDAAKTVHFDHLNAQDQPKLVWPASFSLARAYVDQLERSKGLSSARIAAVRQALVDAESASGASRRDALNRLAVQLGTDASVSTDASKVRTLAAAVRNLAI